MRTRVYDFREELPEPDPGEVVPARRLGLHALVLGIAAGATFLYLLGGPPQLPVRPDPRAIVEALRSTNPSLQGAASWCFALAWALWIWTAGSLLIQVALSVLDRLTGGAAWVLALRPAVAPLLMPLARRAFPVLTAGVIVARLATSPVPGTAAAPAPLVLALPGPDASVGPSNPARAATGSGPIEHAVTEGDTLWALAERYYGAGDLFPILHEANLGRPMPDGTRYEGRLRPGQLLLVPPLVATATPTEEQFVYTVERGDTLRAIAARFLGDEMRWPEIFALNKGVAALPDGRTLADPDLIWPGLDLAIPAATAAATPAPGGSQTPPSAPPASASPSPSPSPSPSAAPAVSTPAASTPAPAPTAVATPTAVPTITPTPASPAPAGPVVTAAPPTPTATVGGSPRPAASATPVRRSPGRAPLIAGAGALGAALAGGAVFLRRRQLLARRELRRRLRTAASPAVAIREVRAEEPPDFAEGDVLGTFTHRAHGGEVEPAVALLHHAARFFAEEGVDEASPLLAAQGARGDASLLVGAPRAARDRVAALAPAFGALLGGNGRALPVRASGDVELRLGGLTAAALLAPPAGTEDAGVPTALPLAELPGGTPLFANWDGLGNVLVAGGPGEGTDIALTGLVATLASRRHPDTLRLWAIARPQALPPELFDLPHWGDPRVDPDDRARVAGLLADLRAELDRRREEPADTARPDLVLVLAEAADTVCCDDAIDGTTLELLATDGPGHGIRLVAATARPELLDDGALRPFDTRLILRLADEAQSVRLLGVPTATALPGGGRLLLRLAGRTPRPFAGVPPDNLRGYRIAPEALGALADQLRRTYGGESAATVAPRSAPEELSAVARAGNTPPPVGDPPHSDASRPGATAVAVGSPEGKQPDDAAIPDAVAPVGASSPPVEEASAAGAMGLIGAKDRVAADGPSNDAIVDGNTMPLPPFASDGDAEGGEESGASPETGHRRASGDARLPHGPGQSDRAPGASAAFSEGVPEDRSNAGSMNGQRRVVNSATAESIQWVPCTPAHTPEEITADLLALDPGEEPPVATPLDIRCFGPFRVLHAGEHLAPRRHAKAWELLQLLAAHPPRSLTRDRLWGALWPDPDGWPTRNVFNTIVGRLRHELTGQVPGLPPEVVQKTRAGECWLDPELVTVDVHRWLAILKREPKLPLLEALAEYRLARALFRPALLEGANYEWLSMRDDGVTPAEDYLERWTDYRRRLARRCAREGRHDLAVPLYRGLLEEQPREEPIVRELFRCYGQTGDLPGLERQLRTLEAVLSKSYGDELDPSRTPAAEEPEQETTALYREIRAALLGDRTSGTDSAGG